VPNIKKSAIVRQKTKIWSWAPDGSPTPRQTGRLTVGRKLTSTSTSTSAAQGKEKYGEQSTPQGRRKRKTGRRRII
jgi:hypothetical protein